jgi:hypothetical protein
MTSRLFLFNPTNEMAIANGQVSYMPPAHLQQFESDLASLPWIMGEEHDYILVKNRSGNSLSHLQDLGFKPPTLVQSPEDLPPRDETQLLFAPWGWSPAVYRLFKPFNHLASIKWKNSPMAAWQKNRQLIMSRETGYHLLRLIRQLKNNNPNDYPHIFLPDMPLVIKQQEDLHKIIQEHPIPSIIKTPWSASGRGLFRIRNQGDDPAKSRWVHGVLKKQGKIYIEKMLNKVQDVSFQFMIKENETEYLGHNFFYTDPSGQFAGCAVGKPENHHPLFRDTTIIKDAILQAKNLIQHALEIIKLNTQYLGPAGVDGIFFEDKKGQLKLQPCLEINLRSNMGLANILLRRKIHQDAKGIWKTGVFKSGEWQQFCQNSTKTNPPFLKNGRISHGFVPMVAPRTEKKFGAWLDLT